MKRTRLRRVSKKQSAINRSYALLKQDYLRNRPACEVKDCGVYSDTNTVHHIKGRGKHTLDVSTFMTVCRDCHDWIHFRNPRMARDMGYIDT